MLYDIERKRDHQIELESDESYICIECEEFGVTESRFTAGDGGGMACVCVSEGRLSLHFYDQGNDDPLKVSFNAASQRWQVETQST